MADKKADPPIDKLKLEDDSDEDLDDETHWLLGFCEEPESEDSLLRHRFPSKVGGRPAWLHPVLLPSKEELLCKVTRKPLDFLLQVYAPVEGNPEAFHRSVYVFISPKGTQLHRKGAVRAFRSQLPLSNPYYPSKPPGPKDRLPPRLPPDQIEAAAAKDPWAVVALEERRRKSAEAGKLPQGVKEVLLRCFPEFELLVEDEPEEDAEAVAKMMREFEARQRQAADAKGEVLGESAEGRAALDRQAAEAVAAETTEEGEDLVSETLVTEEVTEEDMKEVEKLSSKERQQFAHFQAVIDKEPDQVLRYCFDDGARPLWPSTINQPADQDIPSCSCCGAPRKFEFQVLPTLINFLGVDATDPESADWGMIAVYTCSASCKPPQGQGYVEEFVWVQEA